MVVVILLDLKNRCFRFFSTRFECSFRIFSTRFEWSFTSSPLVSSLVFLSSPLVSSVVFPMASVKWTVTGVSFNVSKDEDISKGAVVEVIRQEVYNEPSKIPTENGVLDARLGLKNFYTRFECNFCIFPARFECSFTSSPLVSSVVLRYLSKRLPSLCNLRSRPGVLSWSFWIYTTFNTDF